MRRNPPPIGPHPATNPAKPGPSSQNRAPQATHHKCQKVYITRIVKRFVAHARVSKDEATSVANRLLPHGQTQRPDPKPICRLPLKDRLNSHSPWPRNLSAHRVILAVSKTPIPRARSTARAALRSAAAKRQPVSSLRSRWGIWYRRIHPATKSLFQPNDLQN
jgi:hypothetical protein